jgi:F0F1-type ATP synthase membrane subunit c/vacuolar-type H+-ATPase subunit K
VAILGAVVGVALILIVLWEGFEVVVLPRRVLGRVRLTRSFYPVVWPLWKAIAARAPRRFQETWLSFYGPLSLLMSLAVWAAGLIVGFALLHWAGGSAVSGGSGRRGFLTDLYLSGTNFFTLGLGDVVPRTPLGRVLTVLEAGLGFGFLGLVISYFPPLNQSFSRREVSVSLLDARAGSPPSAGEMLRRHRDAHGIEALRALLSEWERWAAEFLESHQSYPVLAYFRSQHENQSWLGALTAVLDTCALVMTGLEGACKRQAELTFAMARHAVVDLCLVFRRPPRPPARDRLPPEVLQALRDTLRAAGLSLREDDEAERELTALRQLYEPYVNALAMHFRIETPPWIPGQEPTDDWQVSEWEGRPPRGRA